MFIEKNVISPRSIKQQVIAKGAVLCGIANIDRFNDAPNGFHPKDIFPDCQSVIVFAALFPQSGMQCSTNSPYTFIRNMMVNRVDQISFQIAAELEQEGIIAVPIPSAEPYDYWDESKNHGRGILSLKHSAQLAGLGTIGKNTLLVNKTFGNMIWLGAILVSVGLPSDPIDTIECCPPGCTLCLKQCPQNALNGITINQKLCREKSTSCTPGGGWILSCNICRKICPSYIGIKRKT